MNISSVLGLCAIATLLIPQTAHPQRSAKAQPPTRSQTELSPSCARMQQMHRDMETRMSSQDNRLKTLVEAMDNAPERRKVAAMSAVIHEMVAQRATRHTMSNRMQSSMAGHMREHMASGNGNDMRRCPMMGGQDGMETLHR